MLHETCRKFAINIIYELGYNVQYRTYSARGPERLLRRFEAEGKPSLFEYNDMHTVMQIACIEKKKKKSISDSTIKCIEILVKLAHGSLWFR